MITRKNIMMKKSLFTAIIVGITISGCTQKESGKTTGCVDNEVSIKQEAVADIRIGNLRSE